METKPIIPDELRFAITRRCDGECRHCYNQSGRDVDRLSSEDFIQILNETHDLNPNLNRITLTGGEPLKEKEKVLQISRFAKSRGIRVRLVTRGWELNKDLCHELKEAGVTILQIGLDSSGDFEYTDDHQKKWDTFHSWLRGDQMGFRKTINGIKEAISAGLKISIRFSLCSSNLNDVVRTYQFVSEMGVSKFKFRLLFPDGRAKKRLIHELISGEGLARAQYDLIQASKGSNVIVEVTQPCFFAIPGFTGLSQNGHTINAYKETCPCGTVAAYIDSNGDVKYCLFDENVIGNVCDGSFLKIWNSKLANEIRDQRCPLDISGSACSSFKIVYSQFNNYDTFMSAYIREVREKHQNLIPAYTV